jgi:plastocyanin
MSGRITLKRGALLIVALVAAAAPVITAAQPQPAGITLVASGLAFPRGVTWDANGQMYVALAGDGPAPTAADASSGTTPVEHAFGLFYAGFNGAVVKIDKACGVPVATSLPSEQQHDGWHQGVSSLAFLDGTLYAAVDGAGSARGNPVNPSGVYMIDTNGGWAAAASLDAWVPAHPVSHVPGDLDPNGEPFSLIADGSSLVLSESNSGQLLRVSPDGTVTRIVDLSDPHRVPTGVVMDTDGNYYVGTLGVTPYPDGSALVFKVTPDGKTETVWTGLTMVTDLTIGPDGALYALEMSTGNTTEPPFYQRNTGKIVRQTGPASAEDVVTGLDLPIAMKFGPDGALYTSFPAIHADGGAGGVARIDLAAEAPIVFPPDILKGSTCAPVGVGKDAGEPSSGPPAGGGGQIATPVATPAETTETSAPGEAAHGEASEGTGVTIKDYAFTPPTLTVPAGATVTWTNDDAVPHTATASDGTFDSGNLSPGQSFSFTFPTPGTHPYVCQYHAGMQGSIVVQ